MFNISWVKIASNRTELDFADNNIAVVEVNEKKICVGKHNHNLFAFAYTCPHAGGVLSGGRIDPVGNVVCPLHGYKFSLTNGRNVSGEGYFLKQWEVKEDQEGVFVRM